MKKIYKKPTLLLEQFATEEIMSQQENVLSTIDMVNGDFDAYSGTIKFDTNNGNVLNSIDYSQFTN